MGSENITEIIAKLFLSADERDWETTLGIFDEVVLLDYTSMTRGEPAMLDREDIVAAWKSFLPGFDSTDHQLSDFDVKIEDDRAEAVFFGHAEHFICDEIWIVEGDYETELVRKNDGWLINKLKLNLSKQDGNLELPKLAGERIARK